MWSSLESGGERVGVWEDAGLTTKIDIQCGPELLLFRSGGIALEETLDVPLEMLENNALDGTLPVRRELVDGSVTLRYGIAGRRRLSSALRTESIREEHWEGLLAALRLAMQEGMNYLLRETEYVLDPDWIWVSGDIRDVKLMAVPIRGFGSPERSWIQWNALYRCLVECGLPSDWRDRISPSRWEKETFGHRLWMNALQLEQRQEIVDRREWEREAESFGYNDNRDSSTPPGGALSLQYVDAEDGDTMQFHVPKVSKEEWIRLGAALICWAGFAARPSSPLLLLLACIGSLPLGLTLYQRWMQMSRRKKEADDNAEIPWDAPERRPDSMTMQAPLESRTTLLQAEGETMVLAAASPPAAPVTVEVVFEGTDKVEQVPLGDEPVRVGRDAGIVQVVIDHAAVSRVHLELRRTGMQVSVSDLGSTNGTYMNDQPLTPHETYVLQQEDRLRIPGVFMRLCQSAGRNFGDRQVT